MLFIAVCDDDKYFTGTLEEMLTKIARKLGVRIEIEIFWDGENLTDAVVNGDRRYDLVFLDIEMGGMNGIETAKKIRSRDRNSLLIYVTSYDCYAIEAYEVQPFRFMVKPVVQEVLEKYFFEAKKRIEEENFYFQFTFGKVYYRLPIKEILYFESKKRIIFVHLENGKIYELYDKLDNVAREVESCKTDFWRIHKSFLVNTNYIYKKFHKEITLFNGEILPISEEKRKEIDSLYCESIEEELKSDVW